VLLLGIKAHLFSPGRWPPPQRRRAADLLGRAPATSSCIDVGDDLAGRPEDRCAQCFALFPARVWFDDGLFLSAPRATEFSFFLAILTPGAPPVRPAAPRLLDADLGLFAGFVASFAAPDRREGAVASRATTSPFAWYRIAFGAVVLLTASLGVVD
jgi:undecaprenyl-diphosphatase